MMSIVVLVSAFKLLVRFIQFAMTSDRNDTEYPCELNACHSTENALICSRY